MQIDGNSIIPYDQIMQTIRHKYLTVILLSLVLAVLSLVSNIYFPQEMEGQWQLYSCIRKIFSKLFNAGIVWAALPFLAGWRSQSLVKAAISGAAIAELTLLLHYGIGYLIGVYGSTIFMANSFWFIAALVLCAPLGMCGWIAALPKKSSRIFWFILPIGAILEPIVTRKLIPYSIVRPWPEVYSDYISGVVLLLVGVVGILLYFQRGSYFRFMRTHA